MRVAQSLPRRRRAGRAVVKEAECGPLACRSSPSADLLLNLSLAALFGSGIPLLWLALAAYLVVQVG